MFSKSSEEGGTDAKCICIAECEFEEAVALRWLVRACRHNNMQSLNLSADSLRLLEGALFVAGRLNMQQLWLFLLALCILSDSELLADCLLKPFADSNHIVDGLLLNCFLLGWCLHLFLSDCSNGLLLGLLVITG